MHVCVYVCGSMVAPSGESIFLNLTFSKALFSGCPCPLWGIKLGVPTGHQRVGGLHMYGTNRPRYFMVAEPLMDIKNGKVMKQLAMGTVKEPLVLLAGGSENIAQHFYWVASEVGMAQ